jgi:hypothetical protein
METSKIVIPNHDIYKIYKLDEMGNKKTVYIFHGSTEPVVNMNELFSEIELQEFQVYNTEIKFSKQQIHKDDSIGSIKTKIIHELGIQNISYNEIYLFSKITEKINLLRIYQEITQNSQNDLRNSMLIQLLKTLNIDKNVIHEFVEKEKYNYEDLLKFDIQEHSQDITIPLGLKFAKSKNLLFSSNPFELVPNELPIYQTNIENPLLMFENQLLLNYGEIKNNTIYLCCAKDVFEYSIQNTISEDYISQIYYPLLSKDEILEKSQLLENQQRLLKENTKYLKPQTLKLHDMVDLYYNMYYSKKTEIPYMEKGITMFDIVIHPEFKTNLPLEAIFKNIHTNPMMAFVKYNPGNRKENIYRLYSDKISKKGSKIPFILNSK